jgi:hypothetical protein
MAIGTIVYSKNMLCQYNNWIAHPLVRLHVATVVSQQAPVGNCLDSINRSAPWVSLLLPGRSG